LPFPEFLGWQIFAALEPFGFPDREYRTGALLAQIRNQNVTKRQKLKDAKAFMRDMPSALLKHLESLKLQTEREVIDLSTAEGRKLATAEALKVFELAFGPIRKVPKE